MSIARGAGGHAFAAGYRTVGGHSIGVLGADVASAGMHGPSPFYNDDLDPAKQYRALNVSIPAGCTIYWHDDGSAELTRPDANPYTFVYELFEDNVSQGQASIVFGDTGSAVFEAQPGSFAIAAQEAALTAHKAFFAGAGSVSSAGQAGHFSTDRTFTCAAAAWQVSAVPAEFTVAGDLVFEAGDAAMQFAAMPATFSVGDGQAATTHAGQRAKRRRPRDDDEDVLRRVQDKYEAIERTRRVEEVDAAKLVTPDPRATPVTKRQAAKPRPTDFPPRIELPKASPLAPAIAVAPRTDAALVAMATQPSFNPSKDLRRDEEELLLLALLADVE